MSVQRIFGVIIFASVANGIDLERALQNENIPCFVPRSTAPINVTWLTSISTWYYPLMSVLDLYREGLEVSGKSAQDLREDELYYDACIMYDLGPEAQAAAGAGGSLVRGFGGQQRVYVFEPVNGMEEFRWRSTRPGSTHAATTYTTLTDNSTFHVSTTCQEGRMTWGAIATTPTLPAETVRMIHEHVISNGFRREHFTGLRYDSCPPPATQQPSSTQRNDPVVTTSQSVGSRKSNVPRQQGVRQWGRQLGRQGWSS